MGNQREPNNININGVLLEIIKDRAQHPLAIEDSEPSEVPAEPVRKQKKAADQESTAERSRSRRRAEVNLLDNFKLF